ncbi:MAG: radical SAM protein [Lachnospiraceae bacterium]|nr:radical SAM protein [Lachnospiraceae bacterium]
MKKSRYNYAVLNNNGQYLLFNTGNHALVELDSTCYQSYLSDNLSPDISDTLSDMGFLVHDDVDELNQLRTIRDNYCQYYPQMNLTIMTTEKCNFRCPYCYQQHEPRDLSSEATEALCIFLMNTARHQANSVNIHWFGGEPLLNLDPILRIEHLLKENHFTGKSYLTTNGYLLTDDILDCLQNETRIRSFQITLDGLPDQHNKTRVHISGRPTYEKICHNIVHSVEKGFFVTIRLNLNKKNANLDPFFESLERLHLDKTKYAVHINNTN